MKKLKKLRSLLLAASLVLTGALPFVAEKPAAKAASITAEAPVTAKTASITAEATTFSVAPAEAAAFSDVPSHAFYADAVSWAVERGITSGTGAGTFSPNQPCTRAQIVTFLYKLKGQPALKEERNFDDVPSTVYYATPVSWAAGERITSGTGDGTFSPNAYCTRAQIVTFLYKYAGSPEAPSDMAFADADDPGAYYYKPVQWAAANGITGGTNANVFSPGASCTRAQAVTFLYTLSRLSSYVESGVQRYAISELLDKADIQIQGDRLTLHYNGTPAQAGGKTWLFLPGVSSNETYGTTGPLSSLGTGTVSGTMRGPGDLQFDVNMGGNLFYPQVSYPVNKNEAGYYIDSAVWKHEVLYREDLNKKYGPSSCLGEDYFKSIMTYETKDPAPVASLTAEVVKGASNDKEKVRLIHDWVARNIAYDYESFEGRGTREEAFTAGSTLSHRSGVCEGYATLFRLMCYYALVPCLKIHGGAYNEVDSFQADLMDGKVKENHAWNAVYLDGGWRIIDVTWDSQNKYYGAGDARNKLGQAPHYTYYGISPYLFGSDHYSKGVPDM